MFSIYIGSQCLVDEHNRGQANAFVAPGKSPLGASSGNPALYLLFGWVVTI